VEYVWKAQFSLWKVLFFTCRFSPAMLAPWALALRFGPTSMNVRSRIPPLASPCPKSGLFNETNPLAALGYYMQSYRVDEDHYLQSWGLCYSSHTSVKNIHVIRAQSTYIRPTNTLLRGTPLFPQRNAFGTYLAACNSPQLLQP
jgi:hypothetical protein